MSASNTLGYQATYEGLVLAILDEGQDTYRIQIIDGADGFCSATIELPG